MRFNEHIIQKMAFHFLMRGDQLSVDILKFTVARMVNEVESLIKNIDSVANNKSSYFYKNIVSKEERVVLYGAGNIGEILLSILPKKGIEVAAVIDTYKTTTIMGKPIITLDEYKIKYSSLPVVITPVLFGKEIERILTDNGISFINIDRSEIDIFKPFSEAIHLHETCGNEQYFSLSEMPWEENEVFVDCGVFDGETTINFIKKCTEKGGSYSKILCFEPNYENYIKSTEKVSGIRGVTLINKGVSNYCGNAKITMYQNASCITDYGTENVEIVTLDEALRDEKVTFIKMDIEGNELAALKGASNIIREQKPKLAVCVYHKAEDIFEIPELLWELNPDYKFYLRHYSNTWYETVLYAIP